MGKNVLLCVYQTVTMMNLYVRVQCYQTGVKKMIIAIQKEKVVTEVSVLAFVQMNVSPMNYHALAQVIQTLVVMLHQFVCQNKKIIMEMNVYINSVL